MAKMIKVSTIDNGYVWINKDEIAYIEERKYDIDANRETSYVVMKTGRRLKVYGSPDYLMMHVIGT